MEFREIYRGITIHIRYDPVTFTFLGNLSGLGHPVSVQAATYEDLQDTCMRAIDDALVVDNVSITDYANDLHRPAVTTDVPVRAVESRLPARVQEPAVLQEEDPFARRRFLR